MKPQNVQTIYFTFFNKIIKNLTGTGFSVSLKIDGRNNNVPTQQF